jgi:hypothetical protein
MTDWKRIVEGLELPISAEKKLQALSVHEMHEAARSMVALEGWIEYCHKTIEDCNVGDKPHSPPASLLRLERTVHAIRRGEGPK